MRHISVVFNERLCFEKLRSGPPTQKRNYNLSEN